MAEIAEFDITGVFANERLSLRDFCRLAGFVRERKKQRKNTRMGHQRKTGQGESMII